MSYATAAAAIHLIGGFSYMHITDLLKTRRPALHVKSGKLHHVGPDGKW